MYHYHPRNPFRPVNWRWEYARALREKGARSATRKRSDDPWLQETLKFYSEIRKAKTDTQRWNVMEEYPDLFGAYLIYKRGEEEDQHPMRFVIEARLLAGQTYTEISKSLGVEPGIIEAFERIFFNVNEKLAFPDYIMTCVMGPSVYAGLSDRDYDLLWKLFGYLYGPKVLDAFVSTSGRQFRPESSEEAMATMAEDARSSLLRKVAVVTRTFIVNQFSQSDLLNIYARLLEIEKATDTGTTQDVLLKTISVVMNSLPWEAGDEPKKMDASPQLLEYDVNAAELSTEEMMQVSLGDGTVTNKDEIESITYPEPKKDGKTYDEGVSTSDS